jgi:ABC-type phosphate transport system substrate-binding protein
MGCDGWLWITQTGGKQEMRLVSTRRLIATCVPCAAAVAVLAAPGAAGAAKPKSELLAHCAGTNIEVGESSLQKTAHVNVWKPDFNTSKDASACPGGTPKITNYVSNASGPGMETWGLNGHPFEGEKFGVVTTDEPPNAAQTAEIEKNGANETLETIPVLQAAVAVIVHLPAGCTATSTSNPGRLVIDNTSLEGIFRGTIKTWGGIEGAGDELKGTGCAADPIQPIVRSDQSGTTHVFKKYLNVINATPFETTKGESKDWQQVSEGTENTTWPKAANVKAETGSGGGELAVQVGNEAGTIGYASLSDVRAGKTKKFEPPEGGAGTATFWMPVQNTGTTTKKPKYQDPSTTGEEAGKANANCVKTKYTNGTTKFPPKKTLEPWNEVTTATKETHYPICGLTYALAFTKYKAYGLPIGEATTAHDYLSFILSTGAEGGQTLIKGNDYEPLTTPLDKEALKGVAEITG